MFLLLISFVWFIPFLLDCMRLERILARASKSAINAANAFEDAHSNDLEDLPDVPRGAFKVMNKKSGYITDFKFQDVVSEAERLGYCVRCYRQIEDYVIEGTLFAYVWDTDEDSVDDIELGDAGAEPSSDNSEHIQCALADAERLAKRVITLPSKVWWWAVRGDSIRDKSEDAQSVRAAQRILSPIVSLGLKLSSMRSS